MNGLTTRGRIRKTSEMCTVFLLLVLLHAAPAAAQAAPGIDRAQARAAFAEAAAMSARDNGAMWGVPLYGPMLFVHRGTRQLIANHAANGFTAEGDVFTGVWPDSLSIYNGSITYDGVHWTMLGWPLPLGPLERGRLLAHEMYHRVQAEQGWPGSNPSNAHLDTEAGRTWLRLEWRALQRALAESGAARREAIAAALLFRSARHQAFPDGAAEERALEMNEGLAEYTGVRAAIGENARAGWVVKQLDNADAQAVNASVVRSFAYPSGAAYGTLLDASGRVWRTADVQRADFGELLRRAYDVAAAPADARTMALAYGGATLFAEEAAREQQRLAQQALFRRRFVDGPTLTLPASEGLNYSFDPNAVVPFGDAGTVYITSRVTDEWGTLSVTADGVLLARENGRMASVVVPAPEDATASPLRGAGWQLQLAEGWTLQALPNGNYTVRRTGG